MSFNYSPKTVTDGLMLCLDAANTKSYPGSGTTWSDIGKNKNNGTLINGPTFNNGNGGNIVFDGIDDYADLGSKTSLTPGTGDFTFELWINPNNWSSTYAPLLMGDVTNGIWIGKNGSNFVLRRAYVADDLQYNIFPITNVWSQIVVKRISNIASIAYNTTQVVSGTITTNYPQGRLRISTDIVSSFFTGKISNLKYYNRGLTNNEVTQNYNALKRRFGL
jgi:hypothetical protein